MDTIYSERITGGIKHSRQMFVIGQPLLRGEVVEDGVKEDYAIIYYCEGVPLETWKKILTLEKLVVVDGKLDVLQTFMDDRSMHPYAEHLDLPEGRKSLLYSVWDVDWLKVLGQVRKTFVRRDDLISSDVFTDVNGVEITKNVKESKRKNPCVQVYPLQKDREYYHPVYQDTPALPAVPEFPRGASHVIPYFDDKVVPFSWKPVQLLYKKDGAETKLLLYEHNGDELLATSDYVFSYEEIKNYRRGLTSPLLYAKMRLLTSKTFRLTA